MLCQNCGENEANVRYTQIINGVKKEMALCQKCSKKLGIGMENFDFNMPINLSSFLGEFLEDHTSELLPGFAKTKHLVCNECGMSFDDFVNEGKFGCSKCYSIFEDKIDSILKNIQGADSHIGRKGKMLDTKLNKENPKDQEEKTTKEVSKIEKLQEDLKIAIKEERYEDAAKIRDEIKKIEKNEK